jgi:hypothetical protein
MDDSTEQVDLPSEPTAGAESEPPTAPSGRGGVGLLPADQPAPDGTVRMSAPRFRTITGLSTSEFRSLASMPVGFVIYLRGPIEASSEVQSQSAVPVLDAAE